MVMNRLIAGALSSAIVMMAGAAGAQDLKIALIYSKTGPLEAYAKQTENGLMLGLEYLTQGTLSLNGRKIIVLPKDDQGKPDVAKSLLEQAYADDKVDLAIGTTASGSALAMLPIAEDAKRVLIVEPAVATLAQDYAFGRDGVAALKEALAATHSKAKIVFEEYAPQNATDFTASAQRLFDALKDKPGRKVIAFIWAGPHPLAKIADLKPERYGIELAPGGNILPVMKQFRQYPGIEGAIYYYYGFPKNAMNDWLVAEHRKRFNMPPDFFTAGGMVAASAAAGAINKAGGTETEKLIAAMEGMEFDTPKGKMILRKEDHQSMQVMYDFTSKADGKDEYDLLDLVREIPISELPVPIRNKR